MKTVLAAIASLGFVSGAYACGMDKTAAHHQSSPVASIEVPMSTAEEAADEKAVVDTEIKTSAVNTETED